MKRQAVDFLSHKFVEFVPDIIEDRILYVSMVYATVTHKCCCGCGNEVVTPLSPTDWSLLFNGKAVTLDPSIGNWGFNCQSHYWIRGNRVKWAPKWSAELVASGRTADQHQKMLYYKEATTRPTPVAAVPAPLKTGFWQKVKLRFEKIRRGFFE